MISSSNRLTAAEIIQKDNSACALSACVSVRADLNQELVKRTFEKHGWRPGYGTPKRGILAALKELGVEVEWVQPRWLSTNRGYTYETAAAFAQNNPTGVFYVWTDRHAFAVIDGRIIDPYYGRPQSRGRLLGIYRVLNPKPLVERLAARGPVNLEGRIRMIVSKNPKRQGTASARRFNEMLWALKHGITSPREILARTSYTQADLDWDISKGYLVVE